MDNLRLSGKDKFPGWRVDVYKIFLRNSYDYSHGSGASLIKLITALINSVT